MSTFLRTLLLTAAATGVAALVLRQLDLEAARDEQATPGIPDMDPDNMNEDDVAMLLDELASQL
ncbi:MAG: hypothetical protein R6T83_12295 [Salinibacter sp.]